MTRRRSTRIGTGTWGITNGLGESARDILPDSSFLKHLNAQGRRAGVRYTVIAGDQTIASRFSADAAEAVAGAVPRKAENWWGFRQYKSALENAADHLRNATGSNDGMVAVESAKLSGVDDVVGSPRRSRHPRLARPRKTRRQRGRRLRSGWEVIEIVRRCIGSAE